MGCQLSIEYIWCLFATYLRRISDCRKNRSTKGVCVDVDRSISYRHYLLYYGHNCAENPDCKKADSIALCVRIVVSEAN